MGIRIYNLCWHSTNHIWAKDWNFRISCVSTNVSYAQLLFCRMSNVSYIALLKQKVIEFCKIELYPLVLWYPIFWMLLTTSLHEVWMKVVDDMWCMILNLIIIDRCWQIWCFVKMNTMLLPFISNRFLKGDQVC